MKIEENKPVGRSTNDPYGIQKSADEYFSIKYLDPARMSSYGHQFSLAMSTNGDTFLNIGSANNLLNYMLTKQGKYVTDLDLDIRTSPTVTAILPNLPFSNNSFNVVLCFQLLEHLPFSMLPDCLRELKRVSNKNIILSLPDTSSSKREKVKYKIYKTIKHPREWRIYRFREKNKEHFWEIGDGDVTIKMIIDVLNAERLILQKHYRNKFNPYHHFFVLLINNDSSSDQ